MSAYFSGHLQTMLDIRVGTLENCLKDVDQRQVIFNQLHQFARKTIWDITKLYISHEGFDKCKSS